MNDRRNGNSGGFCYLCTPMFENSEIYVAPCCRIVGLESEARFLASGGNGGIDPGTDDPWEDG